MKITQAGVTAAISLLAPAVSAVLTELANENVISTSLAAIISGAILSLAAGWHGNAAIVKRQATIALPAVHSVDKAVDATTPPSTP